MKSIQSELSSGLVAGAGLPAGASPKQENFSCDRTNMALLLAACLLLFFAGLWSWGFIDPGDGYFSEAAREMIERGDYVVPHLNYQIYFSKPILIFWLIISAYKVFGVNEFAARFWSAALATVLTLVCYWTTRCLANKRAGLIAGFVLASSPLVVTFAKMSLIDMSFSSLLGIALCSTALTLFTGSRKWWPWIYISLALAVLDKGPAAVVLYAIGMAGYVLLSRRSLAEIKDAITRLQLPWGIPLFTAIALPWYLLVGVTTNWLWPQVFFLFENLGRFAGHTNHKSPYWWFYLPVLAYGFFPWVLFLPAALVSAFKAPDKAPGKALDCQRPSAAAMLLFASWTVGVLIFFSASLTKLQTYILPDWPAMAMLVGITLDSWIRQEKRGRYLSITAALIAGIGAICLVAAALVIVCGNVDLLSGLSAKWAPALRAAVAAVSSGQRVGIALTAAIIGIGFIAYFRCLRAGNHEGAVKRLLIACSLGCAIGSTIAFQLGYQFRDADVHQVVACLQDKPGPVAIFREFKPAVIYHLQRPVDTFFNVDQLRRRTVSGAIASADDTAVQYVIAGRKGASELLAAYPGELTVIAKQADWYVFETRQLIAVRLPTLERSFVEHIDLSGGQYSWGTLPFAGGSK